MKLVLFKNILSSPHPLFCHVFLSFSVYPLSSPPWISVSFLLSIVVSCFYLSLICFLTLTHTDTLMHMRTQGGGVKGAGHYFMPGMAWCRAYLSRQHLIPGSEIPSDSGEKVSGDIKLFF